MRGDLPYYFSYAEYVTFCNHSRTLAGAIAVSWPVRVDYGAGTLEGQLVSANYFSLLGIQAAIGRTFEPSEDRPGANNPPAVISYNYWQS